MMMLLIIYFAVKFLVVFANKDVSENCTVPDIPNGFVHELTELNEYMLLIPMADLAHNTEILITCADNYELASTQMVDENFALKCNNGSYQFIPSCVPIRKGNIDKYQFEMQPGKGKISGRRKFKTKAGCLFEPREHDVLRASINGSRIQSIIQFPVADQPLDERTGRALIFENESFPHGVELKFRCEDISTFAFLGNATRICENGKWSGKNPHCIRLYSYSFYSAPVVTYKVIDEYDILENGTLSVQQNSNVTITCLWLKDNGEPHWKKDGKNINKDQIPSILSWNKKENAFSLFIPKIQTGASGHYLCFTPNRKRHGVNIIVKPNDRVDEIFVEKNSTECFYEPKPAADIQIYDNGVEISKSKQAFPNGTTLTFICKNVLNYHLEGDKTIQCIDGKWTSWPNCTLLTDSVDSSPPLDIHISGSDTPYFVNDKGEITVPKETTVSFICKYSGGKPIMSLHGVRLRHTMGQLRSGSSSFWYLRADMPSTPIRFTFVCKIPRKDVSLSHSVDVVAKSSCKLDERKMQHRWRGSKIIPIAGRQFYLEDEVVSVQCDEISASVIPSYFRCGDKGNWIAGTNQRCRG